MLNLKRLHGNMTAVVELQNYCIIFGFMFPYVSRLQLSAAVSFNEKSKFNK